ncbi:MAG: hypothetical protein M3N95_15255 [Actinomycetota bacterium]|nr:hypothetical protein [Actinomycetota bacterium]
MQPWASPQLVRRAVIADWPAMTAEYIPIAWPHPPPGMHDGAGSTWGEPIGLTTAGFDVGWYCQYVLPRSIRIRWPTPTDTARPLSASVKITTLEDGVAEGLRVGDELLDEGEDDKGRTAEFVPLWGIATSREVVHATNVKPNVVATSITADVFSTYSP